MSAKEAFGLNLKEGFYRLASSSFRLPPTLLIQGEHGLIAPVENKKTRSSL